MKQFNLAVFLLAAWFPAILNAAPKSTVVVSEDAYGFTLSNGVVTAEVSKRSGDLTSLKYQGLEMLDSESGRSTAYWSHNIARGEKSARITIDPQANGGERGEVAVKGTYDTRALGSGPGGSVAADIEIRYALGRGDSGIYTYSIFEHSTNYPATSVGEARFCAKLNDALFDWMTVDANRNMQMITAYDWNHGTVMNLKEARRMNSGIMQGQVEHKYDYSANQFDVRAWGWSSTKERVGVWFVNPSVEYLSGGPTKMELSAHRDATFNTNALTAPAAPTLLNYWRGSHYGGSICSIAQTDAWTKVIGPFLIYCNSGRSPNAMWKNALARSEKESAAWPYDWVSGVDYPHKEERGVVSGQLVLNDPLGPKTKMTRLLVGLSAPDYTPPRIPRGPRGFGGFGPGGGGEDDTNSPGSTFTSPGATNETPGLTNLSPGANLSELNTNAEVANTNMNSGSDTNQVSGETNRIAAASAPASGTNSGGAEDQSPGSNTNSFASTNQNGFDSAAQNSGTNQFGRGRFGRGRGGGFGFGPRTVDWQNDAKHYEFWVRGDSRGRFTIPNVRPGTYTLHAIADGVLGEFALSNVVVAAGQPLNLGKLNWQPVRHGRQLWDIGIPNRTGAEFFKGDDYFHWGWFLEYPKLFPNDVNYVIGKSNFRKDWFFEQVPHNENPTNTTGTGQGRSTTWTIAFNLPSAPRGKATLRLAFGGFCTRSLEIAMNDQPAGSVTNLMNNSAIQRDGIGGYWTQREVAFDASLMKAGKNVMKLTIPAGGLASGIIYDYLRLELDEAAPPPAK